MNEIQIIFSLWYPSAEFWSHPFWFWYILTGALTLMVLMFEVAIRVVRGKLWSPTVNLRSLVFMFKVVFLWPFCLRFLMFSINKVVSDGRFR